MSEELDRINQIAEEERRFMLRNRAMLILEGAIWCVMDATTVAETVKILRDQAEHLEQFS